MARITLPSLEALDPTPRKNGNNWRFLCPECGAGKPADDAHRSLRLDVAQGFFKCHRCGMKGKLGSDGKVVSPEEKERRRNEAEKARLEALVAQKERWDRAMASLVRINDTPGDEYLSSRGIAGSLADACHVKYSPRFPGGRPAVVFPLRHGVTRKLTAMQARYIIQNDPKDIRMMTLGSTLEGLFETPGCYGDTITITEAPIDAMSLSLLGYPAMATCGKTMPAWLPELCRGKSVLLASDNDSNSDKNWGDITADSWAAKLEGFASETHRLRPDLKDWNDELRDKLGI